MGPRARLADRLPRRLRPRRGGRAGGVRDRRRALAARRRPGQPGRLAADDGAQPRDRPHPARPHARRRRRSCSTCRRRWTTTWRTPTFADERLELIFTCCHPALAIDAQVALTLRTLGGLTTDEIARAFLRARADDGAAARAREAARSPRRASRFACRPAHLLPERLAAVLAVVYLVFNEGYGGRGDLAAEAIRLGRALAELMPDEPEVLGLLALMLLHDARRDARLRDGELVLLRDQDRSLWDDAQIDEGRLVLDRALALHGRGPYVVQAAIAALHADDPVDWPQIAALYGELSRLTRVAGRRAEPRGRGRRGGRPARRARDHRPARARQLPLPARRPRASCCAGSTEATRRASRTPARSSSRTPTTSGGSSNGSSPRSNRQDTAVSIQRIRRLPPDRRARRRGAARADDARPRPLRRLRAERLRRELLLGRGPGRRRGRARGGDGRA